MKPKPYSTIFQIVLTQNYNYNLILILLFACGISIWDLKLWSTTRKHSAKKQQWILARPRLQDTPYVCPLRAQCDTLSFFSHRATTLKPQLPASCCAKAFKTCPTATAQKTAGVTPDTPGGWDSSTYFAFLLTDATSNYRPPCANIAEWPLRRHPGSSLGGVGSDGGVGGLLTGDGIKEPARKGIPILELPRFLFLPVPASEITAEGLLRLLRFTPTPPRSLLLPPVKEIALTSSIHCFHMRAVISLANGNETQNCNKWGHATGCRCSCAAPRPEYTCPIKLTLTPPPTEQTSLLSTPTHLKPLRPLRPPILCLFCNLFSSFSGPEEQQ